MRTTLRAAATAFLIGAASGAYAQTPVGLTISGNQALGSIVLPGDVTADLTITFENPQGLTPTALEATVQLVDPLDPALLPRLPALTSIPSAFPVLLRIGPGPSSSLRFRSVATVSLHTHNLVLNPAAPQSLLKAHDGGSFTDITTSEGIGSYRVSGGTGDFSEFLIVSDARSIDAVILDKFDALQATIDDGDLPLLVGLTLQLRLSMARTLYLAGNLLSAINALTNFLSYVIAHTGADIPGVWDAGDPGLLNVAGRLRTGAGSLQFSIDRKASQ